MCLGIIIDFYAPSITELLIQVNHCSVIRRNFCVSPALKQTNISCLDVGAILKRSTILKISFKHFEMCSSRTSTGSSDIKYICNICNTKDLLYYTLQKDHLDIFEKLCLNFNRTPKFFDVHKYTLIEINVALKMVFFMQIRSEKTYKQRNATSATTNTIYVLYSKAE